MFDTRRNKLKKLADKVGGSAALAKQYNLNPDYLYQLINGRRNIGEKSARKLELSMGLADKYLDIDDDLPINNRHHGAISKEAAQIATEYDALHPSKQVVIRAIWQAFIKQSIADESPGG